MNGRVGHLAKCSKSNNIMPIFGILFSTTRKAEINGRKASVNNRDLFRSAFQVPECDFSLNYAYMYDSVFVDSINES